MKKEELKNNRYYQAMVKQKAYCTLPFWIATKFNLTMNDVALFSIIYQFTNHGKKDECYSGSIERLCTYINATKPTVRASLELLHDRGFICKEIKPIKDKKTGMFKNWVTYRSCILLNLAEFSVKDQLEKELYFRKIKEDKNSKIQIFSEED